MLRETTNPEWVASPKDLSDRARAVRTFYTDEDEEIIREQLARMGKEYKPKQ